jgi:hypothetical protein
MSAPTSIMWQAYLLELLLAESATWQSIVGAYTAAQARDRIWYPWAIPTDEEGTLSISTVPPRAIISDDADVAQWRRYAKASGVHINEDGTLNLSLEIPIPSNVYGSGIKETGYWFADQVGKIVDEILAQAGRGEATEAGVGLGCTHLNVTSIQKTDGPFEVDPAEFSMEWMRDSEVPQHVWSVSFQVTYR